MIWQQILPNSLPLETTDASEMPEAGVSCSERFQISSFFSRLVPWLLAIVCPRSSLLPLEPTLPALVAVFCTAQRHPRNALVCGTLCLVLLGGFSKVSHLRIYIQNIACSLSACSVTICSQTLPTSIPKSWLCTSSGLDLQKENLCVSGKSCSAVWRVQIISLYHYQPH